MLEDLLARSVANTEGAWFRTPYSKSNEVLATLKVAKIPKDTMKYPFVAVNLGQHELAELILSHAEKLDNFEVKWNHRVAGVQQDGGSVTVCAVTSQGEKFFEADCDGAGSGVRRALFIPFEGHTWTVVPVIRFVDCRIFALSLPMSSIRLKTMDMVLRTWLSTKKIGLLSVPAIGKSGAWHMVNRHISQRKKSKSDYRRNTSVSFLVRDH